MPKSKLTTTDNFLDLYLHAAGQTQVPRIFHVWGCLSLIASCLADRVWYEKFRGKQLRANLYTILIGPSGCGKGEAIDYATSFVPEDRFEDTVHPYRGKVTGAAFSDVLAEPRRDADGRAIFDPDYTPIIYLITPELSSSLGEKKIADDFIKRVTDLYTGGDYKYHERTRTNGTAEYKCPVINWIAGSTLDWLHESVSRSSIVSGFFGRAIPILQPEYNLDNRITDPSYPEDRDEVIVHLRKCVRTFTTIEGRFELSNQAREVRDTWYQSRPVPSDPAEQPSWMRADDLVLKLSMILSVASGRDDFLITSGHVNQALTLVSQSHQAIPYLVRSASQTPQTAALNTVADFIKLAKRIPHSALLKKVAHRGIHAKDLQLYIETLRQQKSVLTEHADRGGKVYVWARTEVFGDAIE